jgi:hypothetical protein
VVSSSDAVSREAAWLSAYSATDGLPALLAPNGGPWDIVQPYLPRTPAQMKRSIFVLRHTTKVERFANIQKINKYSFRLICWWSLLAASGSAEAEQQNFDNAIELVLQRITALIQDKTHGGRFLSVAEDPADIEVQYHDPMQTLDALNTFIAEISYSADDPNYNA